MTRTCRGCGCAEDDACIVIDDEALAPMPTGCAWVEDDLCSACAMPETKVRGPLHGATRLHLQRIAARAEVASP